LLLTKTIRKNKKKPPPKTQTKVRAGDGQIKVFPSSAPTNSFFAFDSVKQLAWMHAIKMYFRQKSSVCGVVCCGAGRQKS
jgi:hypothetical protein